ncbi:helix-turn-helix transcriptional regulator [Tautonia sp. JC769]|uniref:helix-turn-helix domain-containing protein n=1 Tax=Tautonia sp. JC769 TaxID=3232135 RepID=UPI003459ED22
MSYGYMMQYYQALMEDEGLSQREVSDRIQELARTLGDDEYRRLHQTRISKWINGEGQPDVRDLVYLAAVIGRPVNDLVYYPGYVGPPEPGSLPGREQDKLQKLIALCGGDEVVEDVLIDYLASVQLGHARAHLPPEQVRRKRGRPPGRKSQD